MSFNERKNRKLKHAYYHNVLENDVCVASYTNILLIGLVGVDKDSDPAFDPQRSIAVKTSAFLPLVTSLRMGLDYFQNKPGEKFEYEIKKKGQKDSLQKLYATFGTAEENNSPLFQLRLKWNHLADKNWEESVSKGLVKKLDTSEPWVWTKIGVCFSLDNLEELLEFMENYLMATHLDNDMNATKKMQAFINYGLKHFRQDVEECLQKMCKLKAKEKREFVEKIILSLTKDDPEYSDEFKIKHYRDWMLAKSSLMYSLFKLQL